MTTERAVTYLGNERKPIKCCSIEEGAVKQSSAKYKHYNLKHLLHNNNKDCNHITHKINEKEEEKTTRRKPNTTGIPDYEIDFLARAILPEIKKLFLREDIKEEFKVWKKNRTNKKQLNNENLHNELVPFVFIGGGKLRRKRVKQSRRRTCKIAEQQYATFRGGVKYKRRKLKCNIKNG